MVAIALFVIASSTSAPVFGCTDHANVYALTDGHLPVSKNIDPCSYWLLWTDEFHRNTNQTGYTVVSYQIEGATGQRNYDSRVYWQNGDYSFKGKVYVGPSSSNTLNIWISAGTGGHFTHLLLDAAYDNSEPTLPGGE
jgi:hypothetical protein